MERNELLIMNVWELLAINLEKIKVLSLPYMPFISISSRWATELNNNKKKLKRKIRRENVYDSEVTKA